MSQIIIRAVESYYMQNICPFMNIRRDKGLGGEVASFDDFKFDDPIKMEKTVIRCNCIIPWYMNIVMHVEQWLYLS